MFFPRLTRQNMHKDERFSQHVTTVKPLKFPSVFRPPGSLPFVALHKFFAS